MLSMFYIYVKLVTKKLHENQIPLFFTIHLLLLSEDLSSLRTWGWRLPSRHLRRHKATSQKMKNTNGL